MKALNTKIEKVMNSDDVELCITSGQWLQVIKPFYHAARHIISEVNNENFK